MFHFGKDDGAWMYEGSAEMFAFKTLKHYDIINSNEFEELMNEQLNKCIMSLKGISLMIQLNIENLKTTTHVEPLSP